MHLLCVNCSLLETLLHLKVSCSSQCCVMLQVLEAIAAALESAGQRHSRFGLQSTAAIGECTGDEAVTDMMSEMATFACQAAPADSSVLTAATAIASQVMAALFLC